MSVPVLTDTPEAAMPIEGYRELFANRQFVALWIGQIFSQLADRIIFVVFITLIVSNFGAEGSLKSYLYIAFTIPAILLTAVAGVFVDRWNRRRTLIVTNLLRALIVATIPLAVHAKSLMGLYACAFGISAVTQFFAPAESATIPMITRPSQLLVANSLFTTTMMASVIFGFALGDPLIEIFGLKHVHWALVGLFLLSAIPLSFVHAGRCTRPDVATPQPNTVANALRRFWDELQEGVGFLREDKLVLQKILKLAVLFSYVVAMCILFISFAEKYLYADPTIAAQKFAYIITFSGIGMVTGALTIGHWLRNVPRGYLVYGGFLGIGVGLIALTLTPTFSHHIILPQLFPYLDCRILFAHTMAFLLGIAAALVAVPLQSALHEMIPENKRGKILGVQFTLLSACSTFPVLLTGVGVDWFGVTPLLLILGAPLLLLGGKGMYDRVHNKQACDAATW